FYKLALLADFSVSFIGTIFTLGIYTHPDHPVGQWGHWIAFSGGIALILGFSLLTYRRYYRKNPVLYLYLVFLFLCVLMAARQRAGAGLAQAFQPRYHLYSALIFIGVWIGW